HRLEMRNPQQPGDIVFAAGEVVIDAQHAVTVGHQPLAQTRAEETRAAGDENALSDRAHAKSEVMTRFRRGRAAAGGRCWYSRARPPPPRPADHPSVRGPPP